MGPPISKLQVFMVKLWGTETEPTIPVPHKLRMERGFLALLPDLQAHGGFPGIGILLFVLFRDRSDLVLDILLEVETLASLHRLERADVLPLDDRLQALAEFPQI